MYHLRMAHKQKPSPVVRRPSSEPETKPTPIAVNEPAKLAIDRVAIPLRADGSPAFESMRESTRAKLKLIISNPETAKELGLAPESAGTPIPQELAIGAVMLLNQVAMLAVAAVTKAPGAIVRSVCQFSEEQTAAIVPPTAELLIKYGGGVISKWSAEATFAMTFYAIVQAQISEVKDVVARTKDKPSNVVPITQPPAIVPEPGSGVSES